MRLAPLRSTPRVRAGLVLVVAGIALATLPAAGAAQLVHGRVTDGAARPLAGIVVTLVDSAATERARALSSAAGAYSLRAPAPGSYRVRSLRIGYRPVLSAPFTLAAGESREEPVTLDDVRVTLEAVRVVGRSSCTRRPGDGSTSVYAAWDQAMTSIATTSLTSSSLGLTATAMQVERILDPSRRRVRSQTATMSTRTVQQPWRSLPVPLLRAMGYVEIERDGATTYHAPGLDVFAASEFLQDHCLRLVAGKDSSEVGVAFEPQRRRRDAAGIRGTLWLARGTAELRRLEFTYTDVPDAPTVAEGIAGGTMTFTRLGDGAIVISRWEIAMPLLEKESARSASVKVAEIRSTGGELVVVHRGADTLYRRPTLEVAGVVVDSLSDAAQAGARVDLVGTATHAVADAAGRFLLRDVLPGEYDLAVRTPSLDSIRASSVTPVLIIDGMPALRLRVPTAAQLSATLCGNALAGAAGRGKGGVLGTVQASADGATYAATPVVGEWVELFAASTDASRVEQRRRTLRTRTDDAGAFRLCGVPTGTRILVRAFVDSARSDVVALRLSEDERFASATLLVRRDLAPVASFRGTVVADSSFLPVPDAEVLLPDLVLATRSDSAGAFTFREVPPGEHRVIARRVGFGALEARIAFAPNEVEERRLVLSRVTLLAEVEVRASYLDVARREFEDNRRAGLGRFLTGEDLARYQGRSMSEAVAGFPGIALVRRGSRAFVLGTRRPPSLQDAGPCYAQVWVDGVVVNAGPPVEPFDVNSIPPDEIESVEWYASPSQTPPRYSGLNSSCGVLVILRRRTAGAAAP